MNTADTAIFYPTLGEVKSRLVVTVLFMLRVSRNLSRYGVDVHEKGGQALAFVRRFVGVRYELVNGVLEERKTWQKAEDAQPVLLELIVDVCLLSIASLRALESRSGRWTKAGQAQRHAGVSDRQQGCSLSQKLMLPGLCDESKLGWIRLSCPGAQLRNPR